ncbi:MAG TPA: HypC/HybG/HupF family hydrogenase formation chaperone [Clostridia bacterium]|nr:HypC/HybG/HupF family hydrogenase formation chaperone [Clostridia bacterium]
MCVGLPARVENMDDGMATVSAGGARRKISVELIEGLRPGDYVMVHAGIAIARITEEEAEQTQEILEELYGPQQ